jgi:hypothetical protein
MSIAMLGSLLLAGLWAGRLLLAGAEPEIGPMLSTIAGALIVLDAGLLLALLARPQRSEWLIY